MCFSIIDGCQSSLPDAQIIDTANKYAVAKGLRLQDYDVSINSSGHGSQRALAPGSPQAPDFSQKIKSMTGADTSAVTYTPKNKKQNSTYTFYLTRNNGKLVMVTKRK